MFLPFVVGEPKHKATHNTNNGEKYPFANFKNDAHIIPELLGNKYLISDFECNECNLKFGRYDDHLAKFLGISRTLNEVRTKEKFASFKSVDKKLKAGKSSLAAIPGIEISSSDDIDNPIDFNFATGAGSVNVKKQSYRPLHVFKSFVKMALCCVKHSEISSYKLRLFSRHLLLVSQSNAQHQRRGPAKTRKVAPITLYWLHWRNELI